MKNNDYLLMPIDISQGVPIYNAHGRVTGYGVTVRYYFGKKFSYSPLSEREKEMDNAMRWVYEMQEVGYGLVKKPKINDFPQSGCFDLYMLCDYTHTFNEFPFFNAGNRAWRFWLKIQDKVATVQKQHDLMQKINENTK